ncbi:restriction endonuclease subunit S [Tenacibaculum sp. Cn5-1]|nr:MULTISPECIES: restriction endonuclease subunit S [unclassified Tenacibaculum]MCF2873346.1 restriction endonuclease subunit S [Tenacibaculum sp. Cn5-1]MCG7509916.1 restriction endonuclease subunit S [Tenacibaculum sp. Cn5-46]
MNYLKTIPFSEFVLWDVKRFMKEGISSSFPVVLLGKYINQRSEKIKLFDFPEEEFGILGVNNKEGIFDAYREKGEQINQAYKKVKLHDLAYNPYRINVGSIGWKTGSQENNFISPAYVVFECFKGLSSEYLYRMFKTNTFNKIINDNTTGSVRQNLKYDTLKNIKIPLPPKVEQDRIVKVYNQKIALAKNQEHQVKQLEQDIENYLFDVLGIEKLEEKESKKGLQFVNFKELVDWNSSNKNITKYHSSKYSLTSILINETIAESVFRGKSPKYDKDSKSFILNQKCNRWNYLELEYTKKVNDNWYSKIDKNFFTKEGDILINSTGEGTIGRSTFISKENENLLYDSHILLLRLDKSKVNPLFYSYLFNSKYGQNQVKDIKSAQSTKQTELGVNNLKKILFPLPENIATQTQIANHISGLKAEIKTLKKEAAQNRKDAIADFEKEIFS